MSKKTTQPQRSPLSFALAFLLGLCLCVSPLLAGCGQQQTTSTSAASQSTTESSAGTAATDSAATDSAATDSATEKAAFDNKNIDYSVTFPSWQKDSKSLAEIVEFVTDVTDPTSANFVEVEDRIATFDMDGTIICEKAPHYADWVMTNHRVLDNPSYISGDDYKPTDEAKKQAQAIRDAINAGEKPTEEMEENKAALVASEFKGLTPAQFREFAQKFAENEEVVGFTGMTYAESFYKPMIEVINYLQANDFTVWMISACEREFVRGIVPSVVDIPLEHIVGTDVAYAASEQGDDAYDKYNMTQQETVVMATPLGQETAKAGKPIAIEREIGKRPILAFGNSSGDYSMLNYAQSNPDHKGKGVLVLCDDVEREHGDLERAAEQTEEATKEGWILVHMSDEDWATIYGAGVERVEYAGAKAETGTSAAAATSAASADSTTSTTSATSATSADSTTSATSADSASSASSATSADSASSATSADATESATELAQAA